MIFLVGLGNPGAEYDRTRHNIGREIIKNFAKKFDFDDFEYDKKIHAQITKGEVGKESVTLILPDTYMNKSGEALKKFITNKKKAESLVVVHDELDMGIGNKKLCFGKKSAGHRGVESVIRAIKTKDFIRLKVGISPQTASGKVKKPLGEEAVQKFILGKFSPKEEELLKKIKKESVESLNAVVTEGLTFAMNHFN